MPTNRSFISQFLSAFRAQRNLTKSSQTTTPAPSTSQQQSYTTISSPPRAITKGPTTTALNQQRQLSTSPGSASPKGFVQRRGSDSSSEGYREVAREGWYVGGRTATGEERFLRLGMVKRSQERLSEDRLSL